MADTKENIAAFTPVGWPPPQCPKCCGDVFHNEGCTLEADYARLKEKADALDVAFEPKTPQRMLEIMESQLHIDPANEFDRDRIIRILYEIVRHQDAEAW